MSFERRRVILKFLMEIYKLIKESAVCSELQDLGENHFLLKALIELLRSIFIFGLSTKNTQKHFYLENINKIKVKFWTHILICLAFQELTDGEMAKIIVTYSSLKKNILFWQFEWFKRIARLHVCHIYALSIIFCNFVCLEIIYFPLWCINGNLSLKYLNCIKCKLAKLL